MTSFLIKKGKHRAWPLRIRFWWHKNAFHWLVKFTPSCAYDLGNADQSDTNKLVGIGYLWSHHKNSVRFGWRYWTDKKEIEISAYCYVNGQRIIQHIAFCEIGREYLMELKVMSSGYIMVVSNEKGNTVGHTMISNYNKRKFQYRLGTYFGGNRIAPHNISIELKPI